MFQPAGLLSVKAVESDSQQTLEADIHIFRIDSHFC